MKLQTMYLRPRRGSRTYRAERLTGVGYRCEDSGCGCKPGIDSADWKVHHESRESGGSFPYRYYCDKHRRERYKRVRREQ